MSEPTKPIWKEFTKPSIPHYQQGGIEPIDFIASNDMGFLAGNVIKYVYRYKKKNGLDDLLKAKQYIEWLIEQHDSREQKVDLTEEERRFEEVEQSGKHVESRCSEIPNIASNLNIQAPTGNK